MVTTVLYMFIVLGLVEVPPNRSDLPPLPQRGVVGPSLWIVVVTEEMGDPPKFSYLPSKDFPWKEGISDREVNSCGEEIVRIVDEWAYSASPQMELKLIYTEQWAYLLIHGVHPDYHPAISLQKICKRIITLAPNVDEDTFVTQWDGDQGRWVIQAQRR